MNIELLMRQLEIDEGKKLRAYVDRRGRPTIGIGHRTAKLEKISEQECSNLFVKDMADTMVTAVHIFPFWDQLPVAAQEALFNIIFNLRHDATKQVPKVIEAVYDEEWDKAIKALKESEWGSLYPERTNRLVRKLEVLI